MGLIKAVRSGLSASKLWASKHALEITADLGVSLLLGAIVAAAIQSPKAKEAYEEKGAEQEANGEDTTTAKATAERVLEGGKHYIIVAVLAAGGIACIKGNQKIAVGKISAVEMCYVYEKAKNTKLMEKVEEKLGKRKAEEVEDEVAKDYIRTHTPPENWNPEPGSGDCIVMDGFTGHTFFASRIKLDAAVNKVNDMMLKGEQYASIRDLYDQCEYFPREADLLDKLGWNVSNGMIEITYHYGPDNLGRPCLVFDYRAEPKEYYNEAWRY